MTSNAIIDQPTRPVLLIGGRAAAVGLALTVMAYGFVMPPEYPAPSEMAASDVMPGLASVEVASSPTPPVYPSRGVVPAGPSASIDAPRPCAVDEGIIEACIFD
jgi:hypothetical protein